MRIWGGTGHDGLGFWGPEFVPPAGPPYPAHSFSASHPPPFLLMWKISSAVPCPPFWLARLSWKLHPTWGGDREGWEPRMGAGDAGLLLCLSPCSCVFPPLRPLPLRLGTRVPHQPPSFVFSSLGSLALISQVLASLHLFPDLQPSCFHPAASGLAAILPPTRPGPRLLPTPRSAGGLAWPCPFPCKAAGAGVGLTLVSVVPKPPPAPLQNLPSSSLIIPLFTLTSLTLSSPPPATMPPASTIPLIVSLPCPSLPSPHLHGQGAACEARGGPERPRMSPSHCASRVPGIGNGGGCGSVGSLPPTTWYPLQRCRGNQDEALKEDERERAHERGSGASGEPGIT